MAELDELDGALAVTTPKGHYVVDFLIFATGFHSDIATRAEFAPFAGFVRRWKDRYRADPSLPSHELAESPDLGDAFAFQEREPGTCAALTQIHCFNHAASLAMESCPATSPRSAKARSASHAASRAACSTRIASATTRRWSPSIKRSYKGMNGWMRMHRPALRALICKRSTPLTLPLTLPLTIPPKTPPKTLINPPEQI